MVEPRSTHSSMPIFCFMATGSWHTSQMVAAFLLRVPHLGQSTVGSFGWSETMLWPQCLQVVRRWSRPRYFSHLQAQWPTV